MFNESQTRFNVKFEIVDIPNNNNQFVAGETSETSPGNFLITINSQIMTDSGTQPMTNMEIAKTILHESIHAYLMVKALHPTVGAPIPNAGNMNVEQLLNAVYPVGTAQHNFMIQNMLPTMEVILNQLLNELTTETTRAECESLQIGLNNQWSWSEYLHYLCYQGLEETSDFQSLFQPIFNSNNVMINGNPLGIHFMDYNTMGNLLLDKTIP